MTEAFETFLFIPIITPGDVGMKITVNGQTLVETNDVTKLESNSKEVVDEDSGHPSGAKRHNSGFTFGNSPNLASDDESLLKIEGGHVLCIDEYFRGSITFNVTTKNFDMNKLELTTGVSTFGQDGDYDPEIFCYAVYYDGKIVDTTSPMIK